MQLTGKLIMRGEVQQVSDKFRKREFAIETADNPQYPQKVLFQLAQDSVDKIAGFKKDQMITVEFDIRGRDWTNPQGEVKYFNTLNAWRITEATEEAVPVAVPAAEVVEEEDDDLPF